MPYIVTSDTYPGSWGRGESEVEATKRWREEGGRGGRIVARIHDAFVNPYVDEMGSIWADRGPLVEDLPRKDIPPVIAECWRIMAGTSRRVPIDPKTGEKVAS